MIPDNIYGLKLHETAVIDNESKESGCFYHVTRVPGGWLYRHLAETGGGLVIDPPVFVPFNKEFDVRGKKKR